MSATKAESPVQTASPRKPGRRATDNAGDDAPSAPDAEAKARARAKAKAMARAKARAESDATSVKTSSKPGSKSDAKAKASRSDVAEAPKPEAKTPETPKPEAPKPEAKTPETPKPEEKTPEAPKPETKAPETPKPVAKAAKKKPGTKSDTRARRRPASAAPSGPPMVMVALILAVFAGAGVGGAIYVAQSPNAQAAIAPATSAAAAAAAAPTTTPAPTPAPAPAAVDTNGPVIAAALRELGAGRERDALDLLAACKTTPEVEGVRERIMIRSREALLEEGEKLRRMVRQGKDAAPAMARLRQRLPESLRGELDRLAVALKRELAPIEGVDDEPTASATKTRLRSDQRPADPADREATTAPTRPGSEPEPAPEPAPTPVAKADPTPAPPREAPRTRPEPTPTPAPSEPEPEPEPAPAPADDELAEGASEQDQADAVLQAALAEVLHTSHSLRGGVVDVTYGFDSDAERLDFEMRGFDKAEINRVYGAAGGHSGTTELELGAGSRGTGKLQHCLDLAGDFDIDMTVWTAYSGGRSQFFLSIGKVGVRWGEQLIKVSKSGSMKPLGPDPDRMAFREERDVTIRLVRRGDELTVSLNGRTVAKKTFDPEDLEGRLGIVCSDVRLVITSLRIKGAVDARKL